MSTVASEIEKNSQQIQIDSDHLLAWEFQAKEYQKHKKDDLGII